MNINNRTGLRQYAIISLKIHQTTVLSIFSLVLFTFILGIYVLYSSVILKALL